MPRLSLSLLGPFQVCLDDVLLTNFRTDKMRALLAYLAVEAGIPHRREALAELLWPDQPGAVARGNLRQALTRLGRAIGNRDASPPFLLITPKTVAFNPQSDYWLDVDTFYDQIAATQQHHHRRIGICRHCMEQLEAATVLYRGDFLTGLSIDGGMSFEEWRLYTQEQLHNQVMDALRLLGDYYERREAYPDAIRHTRQQLALEPWQEEAHRQLMRTLALSGQRRAALNQYETCRRILAQELGTTPEDATTTLYQQIHAGGDAIESLRPALVSHNLPNQLTPFVGRQTELAQVVHNLANPDCHLLTILGPGGVGKTRLALQAAAEQRYAFPDGVWFVPLASVRSPDLLAPSIAFGLGIDTEKGQDPKTQLVDHLRPLEVLLVLDDFEHLTAGADLLLDILRGAPGVRFLVTSRQLLNFQAEFLLTLDGLPYPLESGAWGAESQEREARSLEILADYEALQLFMERANRVRSGFSASADTLPHVVRICQLVEGLPLGVELAAAMVQNHSLAKIADQIQENLDFLATSLHDIPQRQQSLRATFEHSWNLLSERERVVYRRCSVFQDTFTLEAAVSIISNQSSGSTDHINALVSKSLLRQNAPGRYDLHPLLGQFAAEKLAINPQDAFDTHARHGRYYLDFLREGVKGESEHMEVVYAEIGNLRAAWEWAVDQAEIGELEATVGSLAEFHVRTGSFTEAKLAFEHAADHLLALPGETLDKLRVSGRLRARQADFMLRRGQYAGMVPIAQETIELAKKSQDVLGQATGVFFWGAALWGDGEYEGAKDQLGGALSLSQSVQVDAALDLLREAQDLEGRCLNMLAGVCWRQGDMAGAKSYLERMLSLFIGTGNRARQTAALGNLGVIATDQGDFSQAISYYQRALRIEQQIGRRNGAAYTNLGELYLKVGAYEKAESYLQQSLEINREIGARQNEANVLGFRGLLAHYRADNKSALKHSQEALAIAEEVGDRSRQALIWMALGHTLLGLGSLDGAREAYQESISLRHELSQAHLVSEPQAALANISLIQGETTIALQYVEEILGEAEDCQKMDGLIDPAQVCLTCFQVLKDIEDPRAPEILQRAHQQLQERTGKISDDGLRHSFLENVASHRALVRLYKEVSG
jgi:predicted ATPase/DNA-binding SARP family transcriptional activator